MPVPLSTPLSQLLIAFTIEFDNELDHRLTEAGVGRRLPISMTMWSNFLRFVGDGITVGELSEVTGIGKSKTLSKVGGMERWRYVTVGPDSESKREGWGSKRGLRREWIVRPTEVGRKTQDLAPPLFAEMERRWEKRFGVGAIDELRQSLGTVIDGLDVELPEYLPIIGSANGMRVDIEHREREAIPTHLSALLSQVLLAYTLDFERESELSLPLTANFVRILGDDGLDVREVPIVAGVSPEATSMAVKYLAKTGYVTIDGKLVRPHLKGPAVARGRSGAACRSRAHAEVTPAPGRVGHAPRSPRHLRRPTPVSGRLARQEEVRRPDEGRHRRPDRKAAALPDGAPPRRVAGRILASEHVRLDWLRFPFHAELG